MIYARETTHDIGGRILPEGDRYELPPGRRQFSLASLMWLLGAAAVTAAWCRWLDVSVYVFIAALVCVVCIWWSCAEKREVVLQPAATDQTELREEVKRWSRR